MSNAPSSSADPAEIAKFEQLAHRIWDRDGEFKPLHRLNPVGPITSLARSHLGAASVLDVGCGGGLLAEALTRKGARVTAIDLAPAMIETAKLHAVEAGLAIDYRLQDAAELADMLTERFDVVCCMEMLEHVADPQAFVAVLAKLVRPGGAVFVSTLNRNLKSFMLAIVGRNTCCACCRAAPTNTSASSALPNLPPMHALPGLGCNTLRGFTTNPLRIAAGSPTMSP